MPRLPVPPPRWIARALLAVAIGLPLAAFADELEEVQRLYYAGQASAAMQRADRFLATNPRDAQMRFMKGVMLSDAKRNMEAMVASSR